jgi:ABC-type dipeptide/oligopeptide/nickel transport system ATPase component
MRANAHVLRNVSLTLRHGEITALVGRSGAGKSTVASLISRFYTPDRGLITMGGIDIHAWSRTAWADAVALVAQEPVLFSATVADNIAYGRPRSTREEIQAAAEAANAHDFIMQLEHRCAGFLILVVYNGKQLNAGLTKARTPCLLVRYCLRPRLCTPFVHPVIAGVVLLKCQVTRSMSCLRGRQICLASKWLQQLALVVLHHKQASAAWPLVSGQAAGCCAWDALLRSPCPRSNWIATPQNWWSVRASSSSGCAAAAQRRFKCR